MKIDSFGIYELLDDLLVIDAVSHANSLPLCVR
jgi:hypothetical protein